MSEIKLDETPTLTFEPFIEEMQPPARERRIRGAGRELQNRKWSGTD